MRQVHLVRYEKHVGNGTSLRHQAVLAVDGMQAR